MVYFKENYNFPRFQWLQHFHGVGGGGSNFFQGDPIANSYGTY